MSGDTRGGRPVRPHRSGGSGIKQDPAPGPSAVPYWQQKERQEVDSELPERTEHQFNKSVLQLLGEMRGMNAGSMTMAIRNDREEPIAVVALAMSDDPADNQAVLDAIEAATDDSDPDEEQ